MSRWADAGRCSRSRAWFVLFALTCIARPALSLPTLHLDIDGQGPDAIVLRNTTVSVAILASDIPASGLFGFGVSVGFDPSLLDAAFPTMGRFGPDFDGTGFDDEALDNLLGSVGLTSNRFLHTDGPIGDDILLGTFLLTAGNIAGFTPLMSSHFAGIGDNILFDATILDFDGETSFFSPASISITPEPGTGLLIAIGLAMMRRSGARPRHRSSLHAPEADPESRGGVRGFTHPPRSGTLFQRA